MSLETLLNKGKLLKLEEKLEDKMESLQTPKEIKDEYHLTSDVEKTVIEGRRDVANILTGNDSRFMIITGPCSIDDPKAALEYAQKLSQLRTQVDKKILLIMRTYFEKPRTTVGWKGLITDPEQNDSGRINEGIKKSRELLININKIGIPTATEFLSPLIHPYISDLITYGAIGARTVESQTHREFVSGLNLPVGLKNSTEGSIQTAIDAITSVKHSHTYIGIDQDGKARVIKTDGNHYAHLILRGGKSGPNYDETTVKKTIEQLKENSHIQRIVIDCSHSNSNKQYEQQTKVALNVAEQRKNNPFIAGIMLESYLESGHGKKYGQSKTDACINWDTTKATIERIYALL